MPDNISLAIFHCPSVGSPDEARDYFGIQGSQDARFPDTLGDLHSDGIFAIHDGRNIGQVSDGTSNTMMIGENCNRAFGNTVQPLTEAGYADWRRGDQVGGTLNQARQEPVTPAASCLTLNSQLNDVRFEMGGEFFGDETQVRNHPFSALHNGLVNFVFADGHVEPVSETSALAVVREAGSMNSGGVADLSSL